MIGSEHLSCLLRRDRTGGRVIGTELREALRIAHDELGVRAVRAHGILDDDLGVYTEAAGRVVHDFAGIDRVYDELMEIGLRPVVELSFMPATLARDPAQTVFTYGAIISPPKDWDRWAALVGDLAAHLIQRYGRDEVVSRWAFEVWNEPNLEVFWSGTPEEYFRLYDVSARALKAVDPGLRVGGPSSAATGWVWELLGHLQDSGAPLDFLSTHVYGNVPLDLRPVLGAFGRSGTPIWWTEWGTTPTHFHHVGDTVFAAAFLLRGMASALGRIDALSHWVASDHFEELGAPPELFHGGFGLLSVGNLRKPRYWALALLARLGGARLPVTRSATGPAGWWRRWPRGTRTGGSASWPGTPKAPFADCQSTDPDFSWQGQWPMGGYWKTYTDPQSGQQFPVWEGHYTYPGTNLTFIPTYSGGMFEAMMPNLVVPETSWGTRSFGLADARTVQVQIKYATQQLHYKVWGMSPSSTADDSGDYSGYGVEGLAFPYYGTGADASNPNDGLSQCHGCATEDVVTPHASFIALDVAPQQAYANIQALRADYPGVYGADGFFDAVNPTTGAVGHRDLVLDQSMIMAALDNALEQPGHPARLRERPGVLGGAHLPVA